MRLQGILIRKKDLLFKSIARNKVLSRSETKRIKKLQRYHPTAVKFYGKQIKIADSTTFLGSYNEIFLKEIYKFESREKNIVIVDCGANIGLSVIFFKLNFPNSEITAFEPDLNIYSILVHNIKMFGFNKVLCRNEAVSNDNKQINFWSEGGHSGKIIESTDNQNTIQVKAVRLKDILNSYNYITFLKIDIEGEEVHVLPDIADQLNKISYLFIEYHSYLNDEQQLDKLLRIITEAGMRYYVQEGISKKYPFIDREIFLKMDLLVNIFCYR